MPRVSSGGENAHADGADQQVAGFVLLNVAQSFGVGGLAFAEHVFDLAAHHGLRAGGGGEFAHNFQSGDWRLGGELKGERLKGVAGEEGDGFAIDFVAGGDAAAQVVVIHARQVVVNEGVGVEAFDGGGGQEGGLARRAAGCGGGGTEDGAQAFAAGEQAVAHGGVESGGAGVRRWHAPVQFGFNPACAAGR